MTAAYTFINNTFIPADQASILVADLAIQRGYGVFDFFKTLNGKPIFLQDHLDRFYHSAAKMHLNVGLTPTQLKAVLTELIAKNEIPDSGIRMTLTGGYSADGYTLPDLANLIITQQPLHLPLTLNVTGISLVTYPYQRQLSEAKTIDYSMAIWLQPFIKENHADDVLYHSEGLIRECPRANFFVVTNDQEIVTAKNNVLKGVIRKNILKLENSDLLKDSGFRITERDYTLEELRNASEAFITSTTKHILPVVKIDGRILGDKKATETGKPGLVTQKLAALLLEKVRQQA